MTKQTNLVLNLKDLERKGVELDEFLLKLGNAL